MKSHTEYTVPSSSSIINGHTCPKSSLGRLCRKLSPKRIDKRSISIKSTSGELQSVFDYFDENGDGKISAAELQTCVRTVGGALSTVEAETVVRASDTDGDGLLGFDDFQRLMEGSASEEEKTDDLKYAFEMYETQPGSGCITPSSLKRMLSRLGEPCSIEDCKAMIRSFDLNGDGVLSFHEFSIMMR